MREYIIAGNWKMNVRNTAEYARVLSPARDGVTRIICPPYIVLQGAAKDFQTVNTAVGAQDVSERSDGAYTGEVSASMVVMSGAKYVITGHSERRIYQSETDNLIAQKTAATLGAGLIPIVCVGETLEEREQDQTKNVITRQIEAVKSIVDMTRVIVAYEPVWAIGTGRNASPEDANNVCEMIKLLTSGTRVLYGGSMTPENAEQLLTQRHIDGGLIGGASLDPKKFNAITEIAGRCAEA